MKHRPILFSTPMVQAIMEGTKTQTRRVCRHQYWQHSELIDVNENKITDKVDRNVSCSYGNIGDLLWVRESFFAHHKNGLDIQYKADYENPEAFQKSAWKAKPSIHMPKAYARIWLRITDVKVERLRSISEEDAKAEGAPHQEWKAVCTDEHGKSHKYGFINIWSAIHKDAWGPTGWNSDPWVWAVTFEVLTTNGILTGDVGPELHGINAPRPTPSHHP